MFDWNAPLPSADCTKFVPCCAQAPPANWPVVSHLVHVPSALIVTFASIDAGANFCDGTSPKPTWLYVPATFVMSVSIDEKPMNG